MQTADRLAPVATGVVGLLGLLSVLDATIPPLRPRLHSLAEILPAFVPEIAGAAAPLGAVLVLLSRGLARRKRRAWVGSLAACLVLAGLHVIAREPEQLIGVVVVIGLLIASRRAFTGRPDPRTRLRTASTFVLAAALATVIGVGSVMVDRDAVAGSPRFPQILAETWLGLVGISGPVTYSSAKLQGRIETTLLLLGVMVVIATLSVALRSARGPHHLRPDEATQLRELLARPQPDSLGYFALRDDKSMIVSPTGKAAVAYRVVGGVSLASGDPLGDQEAWPGAIDAWLTEARSYAWIPAVLGASEQGATVYRRHGLDALELGDEAVLEVGTFTLQSRAMRSVRQAVSRAERRGYTVTVDHAADLRPAELARLADLAAAWRVGQAERGFSMALGRFGDQRDPGTVVVTARDADWGVVAILALVPWGADGLSLDLMTRSAEADNGVVELMVTRLLAASATLGIERISLNFAVFRSVFERGGKLGAGPVLRLWYRTLLLASRFWQIESLYRANAKYQPSWQPRFICFPRARDLPRISTAALRAEAFLRLPWRHA